MTSWGKYVVKLCKGKSTNLKHVQGKGFRLSSFENTKLHFAFIVRSKYWHLYGTVVSINSLNNIQEHNV